MLAFNLFLCEKLVRINDIILRTSIVIENINKGTTLFIKLTCLSLLNSISSEYGIR